MSNYYDTSTLEALHGAEQNGAVPDWEGYSEWLDSLAHDGQVPPPRSVDRFVRNALGRRSRAAPTDRARSARL